MTYYGRWTYKFEEAARQGAAAALIVHDTFPAAYGWNVVNSSWTGAQYYVAVGQQRRRTRPRPTAGSRSRSPKRSSGAAGKDLATLSAAAGRRASAPFRSG